MLEIQNSDEQAERLRTLIEGLPDAIFFKDGEGRWRIVNSAGLRLFSLNDSAWEGNTDQELGEFHPEFADYFDACQQHDEQAWAKGSRYDTLEWVPDPASGEAQTFEVTKIPLFHADGSRRGLVTVGRNVTARQKAEAAATRLQESLRRLGQIAALSHLPMAAQFKQALALGAAHFDLEIGIVSRIEGNTYRIAAQVSPPGALEDGQEFPFGETYCSITCREQRVVAIHHMGISPYLGHPCYQAFRLETYIGAPVLVEGKVVGTINFSSPRVYDREFDAGDREFMALLAGWVSSAIEREAIQQRLREREEELRAIIENEPQCVKLLGPRGQLLQMNRAGLAMLEVDSFEEARDAGLINFVRPAYRESFSTLNRQVFGGDQASLEFEVVGRRGTPRWLETHAAPLFDEAGQVTSLLAVTRDITDRKLSEDRLRESERRYRTLFDNMLEGVTQCRMVYENGEPVDFIYLSANPAFERLTGLSGMVGRRSAEVIPGLLAGNPELLATYDRVTRSGQPEQFETYIEALGYWLAISVYRSEPGCFVAILQNISDRKRAEATAYHLAYFDGLTDLPNRRMLEDRLNRGLVQARRYSRALAVMFMDLDHFKEVNDTLGHHVGDELLKVVAGRLATCVRAGDTVARSGGDEFIIVLSEITAPEDAAIVARKLIASISVPVPVAGMDLQVGASIGIAVYPVAGTDDAQELMRKADQAMYEAKKGGRNQYQIYSALTDPKALAEAQTQARKPGNPG